MKFGPKEIKELNEYLRTGRNRKREFLGGGITFASDLTKPEPKKEIVEIDAINSFVNRNPRADGGRAGYFAGALVQGANVAKPIVSPLLRKGAEIIGGTALGKRLSDTFLTKKEDEDKKEIISSDDKKPNIEPPEDPLGDAIGAVELATTANDIKKIVEDFRAQKTSPGSSQPKMTNFEKSQLLNLVVDKFKKDQGTLPSFTQVKNFLPGFPNLPEVIEYSQLELPKQKADYDRSDPAYIKTMEDKAQGKALEGNTISIFGQKNFYPENVTLPNGDVVNAKTFFEENFAKRVQLGPGREETKALTLNNKELAKIFNTNVRKIEKATKIIKDSPDFKAEYPPPRPANYGNLVAIERLKEARKYLTEAELTNIKSQEQQLNNLNTMFKTGELVVTDFPNLVKAINTTLDKETGKLDFSIKKSAEQMIKRSKNNDGLFDISHTIPKTSEQKNIEFLRNRNILDYKTNQGLFKSFEAYVRNKKDDPEYNLRLQEFDAYMKEMGQRVKIGNKFFGLDEKMFDSVTGEHTGINRALEYFGLPKFENGVPLRAEKYGGGSVNIDLTLPKFATGGRIGFESGTIPGGYTDDAYAYLREIDDEIFNAYKKYKAGGGHLKYGPYAYNAKRAMFGAFGIGVPKAYQRKAEGGIIGDKSGPPPERGPNPQGLPGLLKRVKNI